VYAFGDKKNPSSRRSGFIAHNSLYTFGDNKNHRAHFLFAYSDNRNPFSVRLKRAPEFLSDANGSDLHWPGGLDRLHFHQTDTRGP
jgi:hypothetical protein